MKKLRAAAAAAVFSAVLVFSGCSLPEKIMNSENITSELTRIAGDYINKKTGELGEKITQLAESKKKQQNIWNVLLIGSDRRDASWNGNSDTMILVSVNSATSKIHMISFMRDTYAEIPGHGARKLNAAYALGGSSLLVNTIESNYEINIDNCISVDFNSMASIIDLMGGVDIEINQAEADYLNSSGYALAAGVVHMDGKLALSYSRIRYVGNSDYERTLRQRRVLTQVFSKIRALDAGSMLRVVASAAGMAATDLSAERMLWITSNISSIMNYELISDRIPYDGLYGHSGEMLVPDFAATRQRLKAELAE